MRRFNGWGDEDVEYPLKDTMKRMLRELVGEPVYTYTASKDQLLSKIDKTRIRSSVTCVTIRDIDRLYHARGQSLPDWISLRFGEVNTFPDGVAYPTDDQDLKELIDIAKDNKFCLIPYGGGTSVLGHINPISMDRPIITVSMEKMNRIVGINEQNRVAEFYAGISGPDIEKTLMSMGYTLGHFPQSFEFSTLGGWVATKSSGQQSFGYGRIDNMFMGAEVYTPKGMLKIPHVPDSAAGPDIKELVLGSEGRIGILSKISVRISKIPEKELFEAYFMPSWEVGFKVVKMLTQERYPLSLLRLSNPKETTAHLLMAGKEFIIGMLKKYLSLRGVTDQGSLLVVGYSGKSKVVNRTQREVRSLIKRFKGVPTYTLIGKAWQKNRFKAPYLRNSLWEEGYAVDTLETCVPWDKVGSTIRDIEESLESALIDEDERVYAFSHLSHFYITGPSIYTTYIYRIARDFGTTLNRWKKLKHAASKAIIRNKGTISHHHGVGLDHKEYLEAEKGEIGIGILKDMISSFDPYNIMNPGKLV